MTLAGKLGVAAALGCFVCIRAQAAAPQSSPRPVVAVRSAENAGSEPSRPVPAKLDLPAVRDHLLTQLMRAAEAGYVVLRQPGSEGAGELEPANPPSLTRPSGEERDTAMRQDTRDVEGSRLRAAPDDAPPLPRAGRHDGGEARDAIAATSPGDGPVEMRRTAPCIPEEALSLSQDPQTAGTNDTARPVLVGEFDRPRSSEILAEARRNLRRGLVVETRLVLDSFAETGPAADALRNMATVLGRAPLRSMRLFAGTGCGPVYRLWQAVEQADAGDFEPRVLADEAMRDALLAQPRAVRGRMAVRLGRAALRAGETQAAHWLHELAARDRGEIDARWFLLFTAELAHAGGDDDAALRALGRMRDGIGRPGVLALLLMARIALERPESGLRGTLRLRQDLGAAARAWRGDPLADELLTAEARLVAVASGTAEAVSLLHHGASLGLIGTSTLDRAVASLASMPTPDHAGTPLAVLYHARPGDFRGALQDPSFRAALARSYASLGIPRLALPLLKASDLADPGLVAALSRAAVQVGDEETARALRRNLPGALGEGDALHQATVTPSGSRVAAGAEPGQGDAKLGRLDPNVRAEPPSVEAAATAAFEAVENGAGVPPDALGVLKRRKPRLAAAVAALTSAPSAGGVEPGSAVYLERLDQELGAIGELLDDG